MMIINRSINRIVNESISDIESEEEIMKFAEAQIKQNHKHNDGTPVDLQVLEPSEFEEEIEENEPQEKKEEFSGELYNAPVKPPIKFGCACGAKFDVEEDGNKMEIYDTKEYVGGDDPDEYSNERTYQ